MFGVSTDDVATQKRFKEELKLPYPLLSDPDGKVSKAYSGTMAVVGLASRANIVIGQDGKVVQVVAGKDAIDPGAAIGSCPVGKRKAG